MRALAKNPNFRLPYREHFQVWMTVTLQNNAKTIPEPYKNFTFENTEFDFLIFGHVRCRVQFANLQRPVARSVI